MERLLGDLNYWHTGKSVIISANGLKRPKLRMWDPWGLVYLDRSQSSNVKGCTLEFQVPAHKLYSVSAIEAFRRRISFLQANNSDIRFSIIHAEKRVSLLSWDELVKPEASETIHTDVDERSGEDKPGRLEKDLQVFLFGGQKRLPQKETYRRLGILGFDFYNLSKNYAVDREYPTGVFTVEVSKDNCVLPTYFMDIISFNRLGRFSVIELKVNDPGLHIISQILDYALFIRRHRKMLFDELISRFGRDHCPKNFETKPFVGYMANNHFHPYWANIRRFYKTDDKKYGFALRQITMGATEDF